MWARGPVLPRRLHRDRGMRAMHHQALPASRKSLAGPASGPHWAPSGRSSTEAGQGRRAVQRRHSPPIEGACSSASGRTVPPASAAPPANETPSRWPAPGRTDFTQEQAQQSAPDSGIAHPFHMRWQCLHSASASWRASCRQRSIKCGCGRRARSRRALLRVLRRCQGRACRS